MAHNNPVEQLLHDEPELDIHLRRQRERVVQLVQRHQFRHKWFVRTLSTFFWATAVEAVLLAALLHDLWLLMCGTVWLLLGTIVLFQSRLKRMELKVDGVLALLGTRDKTEPVEQPGHGAENTARPPSAGDY